MTEQMRGAEALEAAAPELAAHVARLADLLWQAAEVIGDEQQATAWRLAVIDARGLLADLEHGNRGQP